MPKKNRSPAVPRRVFNAAIVKAVCELISQGWSMRKSCEKLAIPWQTFNQWSLKRDDVHSQVARAREAQAEVWADEIVSIADRCKPEFAAVARLRIETRRWMLEKMLPKKYGLRPEPPATVNNFIMISEAQRADLQRRLNDLDAITTIDSPKLQDGETKNHKA